MVNLDKALQLHQDKDDAPAPPPAPRLEPTPERQQKDRFEKQFTQQNNSKRSKKLEPVYRLQPWHKTMSKRGKLNDMQTEAIDYYVAQFDICNRSLIKSNLNRTITEGDGPSFKYLDAVRQLNRWDAAINASVGRGESWIFRLVCCSPGRGYMQAAKALYGEHAHKAPPPIIREPDLTAEEIAARAARDSERVKRANNHDAEKIKASFIRSVEVLIGIMDIKP